jgi:hypothetical protein
MRAKEKINSMMMMMMLPFRICFSVSFAMNFLKTQLACWNDDSYTSHFFFYILNGCRWIIKPNRLVWSFCKQIKTHEL